MKIETKQSVMFKRSRTNVEKLRQENRQSLIAHTVHTQSHNPRCVDPQCSYQVRLIGSIQCEACADAARPGYLVHIEVWHR